MHYSSLCAEATQRSSVLTIGIIGLPSLGLKRIRSFILTVVKHQSSISAVGGNSRIDGSSSIAIKKNRRRSKLCSTSIRLFRSFESDRKHDSPWCEHGISAVPRTAGLLHTGTNTLMTFRPSVHRVRHTAPAGFHWESSCVDMAR